MVDRALFATSAQHNPSTCAARLSQRADPHCHPALPGYPPRRL